MPEISRFFGIVVRMYFDDHNPPHYHAWYIGQEARVGVDTIDVLSGDLPRRARSMVVEWAALHQQALMQNWNALQSSGQSQRIAPLE